MSFFTELRRRNVFKVGIAYMVIAWLVAQVLQLVFDSFGTPDWVMKTILVLLAIGAVFAVFFAWVFEMTSEGLKRESELDRSQLTTRETGQKFNYMIIASLVLALGYFALDKFVLSPRDAATLEASTQTVNRQASSAPAAAPGDHKSIAVMPLVNMSSHEENAYFAGGVHEDILTLLSRVDDLKVISRTSMLRYATSNMTLLEVGHELGVDFIVEGSVRRIGNHVRVTIQLINAFDDAHLWANNFERELVDVFATQSELAREISDSLLLEIQPESVGTLEGMPTTSVKAYDLFIKAESIEKSEGETEETMLRRRAMLEQAVTEDPDFVEAWAVLKRLYDLQLNRLGRRGWYLGDGADRDGLEAELRLKSERALDKAIALDPDNVETLLSIAVDHVWPKTWQEMQESRAVLDRIIASHPENAKAWYHLGFWHSHLRDFPDDDREALQADAAAAFEEALRLDPFNARMVSAVLNWSRDNGYAEHVARLSERIKQIIPETADDRRLARVSWGFRRSQIRRAFVETADESLIGEFEKGFMEAVESNDFRYSWAKSLNEMDLRVYTNEQDRLLDIALTPIEPGEGAWGPMAFSLLRTLAIELSLNRGNLDQARLVAEEILEHEEVIRSETTSRCSCLPASLARAYTVVGNTEEAQRWAGKLLEERGAGSDWTIYALMYLDLDRSVELAFEELARSGDSRLLDEIAAYYVWNRVFLAHPKVQAYYLDEGKWIDYLAARVPEYAKYRQ